MEFRLEVACSIVIGTGHAEMEPGSVNGFQLVVTDVDAARAELTDRGVDVSEIQKLGRPGRPEFRFSPAGRRAGTASTFV
jgi:hypothetical protein